MWFALVLLLSVQLALIIECQLRKTTPAAVLQEWATLEWRFHSKVASHTWRLLARCGAGLWWLSGAITDRLLPRLYAAEGAFKPSGKAPDGLKVGSSGQMPEDPTQDRLRAWADLATVCREKDPTIKVGSNMEVGYQADCLVLVPRRQFEIVAIDGYNLDNALVPVPFNSGTGAKILSRRFLKKELGISGDLQVILDPGWSAGDPWNDNTICVVVPLTDWLAESQPIV